jgi:hypothetical protein
MNTEAMKRLLAAMLADQTEHDDAGMALDEARLTRALSGEEPLTGAEQDLLWTSPAARQRLFALRGMQRSSQYLTWRQIGIEPLIPYRAAADGAVQTVTIDSHPDWTIKLFPLDEQGDRWTIFLKLSERVTQSLVSGIRLVDTGDAQWLAGHVDKDGELSADWVHQESPLQRLHRYELRIDPL